MIHQFANFKVFKDKLPEAESCIINFVNAVTHNEKDTFLYLSLQSQQDNTEFTHYMIFKDSQAESYHKNTEWVKGFVKILYPICEKQPVFTKQHLVVPSLEDIGVKMTKQ